MKLLLLLLMSTLHISDSISILHTKIHSMEDLGRMDKAITYNQQLLDLLSASGDEYSEEFVWSLVDMSYFYSSTGALLTATDYATKGIHESHQYISRNIPLWIEQTDTSAISDAMTLCESSIRQCYYAIADCYVGASPKLQNDFKTQFALDSIISYTRMMCSTTDSMVDSLSTGAKSRLLRQLSLMYKHILWESWLFAHHLSPTTGKEIGYMRTLYNTSTDVNYRLRAALRIAVTASLKEQSDSALYWLDVIERLDTTQFYKTVVRENKAWIAAQNKDWHQALPLLKQSMEDKREALCNDMIWMTARARQNTWVTNYAWFFQQNVDLCSLTSHPDSVNTFLYDNTLIKKGLLLSVQTEIAQLLREHNMKAIGDSLYLVRQLRHQLQQQELRENKKTTMSQINEIQSMEHRILDIVRQLGDFTKPLQITTKNITANLDEQSVAVEFIRVRDEVDTAWLQALVLRKEWSNPRIVTIGKEATFVPLIKQRYLYNTSYEMTSVVWGNIIREAEIQAGETVYFSPDGIFHILGIEYLPVDDSVSMFDRYNMRRVSSTLEICRQFRDTSISTFALYGGLKYTTDITKDNNFTEINYLPESLREVEQIHKCIGHGKLYKGHKGTEESVRKMSGKAPAVIHFATHGFSLSEKYSTKLQQRDVQFVRLTDGQKINMEDVALTRSGLLLADAGQAWNGGFKDGCEDGILTAREISLLNLQQTQMVVLSACDSGLGYATIDGIAGLQRGFKQAGIQSMIMSLGSVYEAATQLLMTRFYYYWIKDKKSRHEAFRCAINDVREKHKDAAYWAGFVMLD